MESLIGLPVFSTIISPFFPTASCNAGRKGYIVITTTNKWRLRYGMMNTVGVDSGLGGGYSWSYQFVVITIIGNQETIYQS